MIIDIADLISKTKIAQWLQPATKAHSQTAHLKNKPSCYRQRGIYLPLPPLTPPDLNPRNLRQTPIERALRTRLSTSGNHRSIGDRAGVTRTTSISCREDCVIVRWVRRLGLRRGMGVRLCCGGVCFYFVCWWTDDGGIIGRGIRHGCFGVKRE